ncbi:enhancer of split M1 protein [Anopheles aquasalis]|uniref:enhancer of split M1 protein n=1 Tax=Anopheles aquasalis TaxID=42839 RepID=UPI00215B0077|nr:enhancer of split M1 protein [Anopheles aquasalis]
MEKQVLMYTFVILLSLQLCRAGESECGKACPHILDPVCATDGRSFKYFSNRCLLEGHNQCEQANRYREVDETNCSDDDWQK